MPPRVSKAKKKMLEGAESKVTEKKERKRRPREPREAPKETESHGPSAASMYYELSRSPQEPRKSSLRAPEELLASQRGARRVSKNLPEAPES